MNKMTLTLAFCILATLHVNAEDARKKVLVFSSDTVIGQIADGEGWVTALTFVNLQNFTRNFNVFFSADDGRPLFLNFSGIGRTSTIQVTLPPRGSFRTETDGASFPVTQGWAEIIVSDNVTEPIGGMAVFRRSLPGLPDFEAVVPFSSLFSRHQFLPFNHLDGFVTGLALANPSIRENMTIAMDFYDPNGVLIISRFIEFRAQEHTAFVLTSMYPELQGRVGLIEFSVSSSFDTVVGPIVLGLRFNPGGAFTTIIPMQSVDDFLSQ